MKELLYFIKADIHCDRRNILRSQGIGPHQEPTQKILDIYERAVQIFMEYARPAGVLSEISIERFKNIFHGEGLNEPDTPIQHIYPEAEHLALFAITVGQDVCNTIDHLFQNNDFALGCMIDSVASDAAERLAELTEAHYKEFLCIQGEADEHTTVVRYSPGYCGWHISAQKKLFEFLEPEEIDIKLRDSYLMEPLKSISGVMITGPEKIHIFKPGFSFCRECRGFCRMKSDEGGSNGTFKTNS